MKANVLQLVFFCVLFPAWCPAVQSYTPIIHDPVLEPWRWQTEEVLADLGVLCMDEAKDGTLWFGNVGSIASYDGKSLTKIPFDADLLSKIPPAEQTVWAKAILCLDDGRLLVLIGESLVLREKGQWKVILERVGHSVFSPKIKRSKDGSVWLLMPDALWRISTDLTECSKIMTSPEYRGLGAFCLDAAGNPWVMEKFSSNQVHLVHVPLTNGVPSNDVRVSLVPFPYERGEFCLAMCPNGTIVCGSSQRIAPLYLFDPVLERWEKKGANKDMCTHYSAIEGRNGTVWLGLLGTVSCLLPNGELKEYSETGFDLPPVPLSLFEASNERLWIIGRIGQVYSVDLSFDTWMMYDGLSFCFETDDGVQWFLTHGRQHVVTHDSRSGKWTLYGPEDGLISQIRLLLNAGRNGIWAGGRDQNAAAIAVFDGTRWNSLVLERFAYEIMPGGAFAASDGTVWFGAQGPLLDENSGAGGAMQFKLDGNGKIKRLAHYAPLEFPYYVTAFSETPDQTLWLGSTIVHSFKRDPPEIRRFPELQGENVVAMILDREQSLWIAKEYFGICRWRGGSWEIFTRKDGLADLKFCDMLLLQDGSILAASSGGISRFDGTSWTTDVFPEWFHMSSRWSRLRQSPDGAVWFNFATDDTSKFRLIKKNSDHCAIRHQMEKNPPDTKIAGYLKQVSSPGNCHVTWSAYDLWGSTPREKMQYSWRLDGGGWSPFSHEAGKTFLSLESGRHTLEVRARDSAFNVDPTPDRFDFVVAAPVWRQVWFVVLVCLLTGLIVLLTWMLIRTRERNLAEKQAEHEAFLLKQQEEREKNLLERQAEHEAFLRKQQAEREQHLLEIDRLKTGFFTNISHELRTPITVILGRLELLMTLETDDRKKRMLSVMAGNAQRMATLITQLLDFRKIKEGKAKIELMYGDVVSLVRQWMGSLTPLAEQAGITCSLESIPTCQGWFDSDKLQKIFTNLITNAIKYTASGGRVRARLQVENDSAGHQFLVLIVEDNGMGIARERLTHIFDRFYRVSEASMAEGAGIGLNLTRELVDLMGGKIKAESPVSSETDRPGTRFTVSLPMDLRKIPKGDSKKAASDPVAEQIPLKTEKDTSCGSPVPVRPESAAPEGESAVILVVEDSEDILDFVAEGLGPNYRVITAKDGDAGLQIAKAEVPDLIVTDIMMPVMDGITLCRELKTSAETSHIPVIMLTAKTSVESQMAGYKTGADDYITKPFNLELLRVRVANLLESRRLLREKFCRDVPVLTPNIPVDTLDKEFLDKAMRVMEERFSEWDFNPESFAAALNMSSSTLLRKLKAVADRTPAAFINEFRMTRAAELLVSTGKTVTEILFEVGCEEPANFTRLFKKYYKVAPSKYREAHQSS